MYVCTSEINHKSLVHAPPNNHKNYVPIKNYLLQTQKSILVLLCVHNTETVCNQPQNIEFKSVLSPVCGWRVRKMDRRSHFI